MNSSKIHIKDLARLLSLGSEEAFRTLYDLYFESLCFYANRMLNNIDESQDVVQNIILKLWENKEEISSIHNLRSYLYRSTYNSCLNAISKHGKKEIFIKDSWLELKEIEMEERDSLLYSELKEIVNQLINQLPEQCQRVFKMNRFDEKTYKEIAEELGITVKAVEGNMSRALHKLREGLKDYMYLILLFYLK